ncbi:MarR family winged helix-turn-helix transcriptional regulator [Actinokineospora diospyrosa]|uniref:DNA-binding transcriptional regulator, MarR family n=1 Tax=Actinokineospora diospyrosa TaxID=103728 RepID=A0ABT1I623_9PSEU|nr:MarR family transcriptional regulator [Actinokineospora diospyrosa]MCP2268026.1 DNA-binding transcriptional regulator, MarR family [Actinokineospora diospyrosa]
MTQDAVDAHLTRWRAVLPDLDPDVEAVVTRMEHLVRHLRRVKERTLAEYRFAPYEYATLHALAGRGGNATPSELTADLTISAAAMTGRLDALEQRGYVRRTHSAADRRRVDVELTESGRAAWVSALNVQGVEEQRILGVLSEGELVDLANTLRRVLLVAEAGE